MPPSRNLDHEEEAMKQRQEGTNIHYYEEMTPEKRPQDPKRDGSGLRYETAEHNEMSSPLVIRAIDEQGRAATFTARESDTQKRVGPYDTDNGRDLSIVPSAYGGAIDDDMPQLLRATDRTGRSWTYEPIRVDGKVVDSKCFEMPKEHH
jgi:hypothetical protein